MSWLFSKRQAALDSTTEATIRAISEKHASINEQRVQAMEKSETYLARAQEIMGFAGQPNMGKRRMAAQLVRYSDRLSAHAESLCNVQMLLAEHLLALEERAITKGVVSMVERATADLNSTLNSPIDVQEKLENAQEALEEQHDSFEQLSREIENGPCPIDFLDDDRLGARLFPTATTESATSVAQPLQAKIDHKHTTTTAGPPPEYNLSPLQERLQAVQASLASAPKVPTTPLKASQPQVSPTQFERTFV